MTKLTPQLLLLLAIYVGALEAASSYVATNPSWNLDGLFYTALVQPDANAYAAIEAKAPAPAIEALERGTGYRRRLYEDADAFARQLPLYTGKPLYIWAGQLATALGTSSARAPYQVSAVCFVLLGLSLPWLAAAWGAPLTWAFGATALAITSPQLRELGVLATPDAFATLLVVIGGIVATYSPRWSASAFAAAALARPDIAILGIAVLLVVRAGWLPLGVVVAAAALVHVLTHSYRWSIAMSHTFGQKILEPADLQRSFGAIDYVVALGKGIRGHRVAEPASFIPFLTLAALGMVAYWSSEMTAHKQAAARLLAAIWLATAARFLAFPLLGDRFMAPAYAYSVALFCALVPAAIRARFHVSGAKR